MGFFRKNKQISFDISEDIYKDFCVVCAQSNINDVLVALIKKYIKDAKKDSQESIQILEETKVSELLNKPTKEYIIKGQEYTGYQFEKYLKSNMPCDVERTIYYMTKEPKQDIWTVTNFTEDSNLKGNLGSGPLRDWKEKGIVGLKLEIK